MIDAILAKIFGTKNERETKALRPTIAAIGELEPGLKQLSDIDLAAKTIEFRERLAQGATLDDLLIEAFAVVRQTQPNLKLVLVGKKDTLYERLQAATVRRR